MEEKSDVKKYILIGIVIVVIICGALFFLKGLKKDEKPEDNKPTSTPTPAEVVTTGDFTTNIIKLVNEEKNYLISPYNIEIALNMLREGADGNTKDEIDKAIGNRTINDVTVKDILNVANAIFVKNDYKVDVKKDFVNALENKYKSEVLYDKFETPDVINNWVSEKTNGMIKKILNNVNKDYVMGLASALALDAEWTVAFDCGQTRSEEFTKVDGSKMNTEMMHHSFTAVAEYIKTVDAEGIILPYKTNDDNVGLEFVAILPNGSVKDYVNNLNKEKMANIFTNSKLATDKYHVTLSLPRFTYGYEISEFINVLKSLGIKEAFDPDNANFKKMIEIKENVYVGEAIHKTYIEVAEKGTKAAAVTYFGMFKNEAVDDRNYEEVNIKFNKPFVYMIREKNTGEILFFGSVYEPNEWKGNTCSSQKTQ